ncbi:MAG TPA: hypothetical protein VMM76_18945, partial [Pirellulaceae bacterium]|nr:hypothetical protein [Pirellulaceae bacterium]
MPSLRDYPPIAELRSLLARGARPLYPPTSRLEIVRLTHQHLAYRRVSVEFGEDFREWDFKPWQHFIAPEDLARIIHDQRRVRGASRYPLVRCVGKSMVSQGTLCAASDTTCATHHMNK